MSPSPPPEIIDALLRIEGETAVVAVDWFDSLPSTRTHALTLAQEPDLPLPRLVWSLAQTAGRGRGTHQWWATDGALTFSLIVDDRATGLDGSQWPQVSVVTGLAVAETLCQFLPASQVSLKWPNDVFASGRKICGILVEVPPQHPHRLVIGVGINVRNSFRSAPTELQLTATSLCDLVSDPPALPAVLLAFLNRWETRSAELARGTLVLPDAWGRYCQLTQRRVRVTNAAQHDDGLCLGIAANGTLRVVTSAGERQFWGGTVRSLEG